VKTSGERRYSFTILDLITKWSPSLLSRLTPCNRTPGIQWIRLGTSKSSYGRWGGVEKTARAGYWTPDFQTTSGPQDKVVEKKRVHVLKRPRLCTTVKCGEMHLKFKISTHIKSTYGLFNDAAHNSDCTMSNDDLMNHELEKIRKEAVEASF
jgi:hypothetical protein